ncbi:hypothetical protein VTJ04DRAFT_6578 [Mycothermus thermophilus]|uniref:uncharacterized protein n=1 Tax=Humicola insolens TaxID=85995 RepID=UPI00374486BC
MDDDFDSGIADDELIALVDAHSKPQQPIPQRLDRRPPHPNTTTTSNTTSSSSSTKPVQPAPQPLPGGARPAARGSGSTILVSPRQKGNPVLSCLKSVAWEYSDIPADYLLGVSTCALFLSLKYHRLHPEYIYGRIQKLRGKYNLRVLLVLVDIPNHEDSLRELSKTSLINEVTVILAWSAAEAARYLELYKAYEHAGFAAIKGQQREGYAERLVEFVTVPRNVNKSDAVALVSEFGSLRNAVNAPPERIAAVSGWGEKKVKSWVKAVEEPFRVRKGRRKGGGGAGAGGLVKPSQAGTDGDKGKEGEGEEVGTGKQNEPTPSRIVPAKPAAATNSSNSSGSSGGPSSVSRPDESLTEGVAAALARLRNNS